MPEVIDKNKENNDEIRSRIKDILKRFHPDAIGTVSKEDLAIIETQSSLLNRSLTSGSSTPKEFRGENITVLIKTKQGLVRREFEVPGSVELTLDALEALIEDMDNPVPPEQRQTVENVKDGLAHLESTRMVLKAKEKLEELLSSGKIGDEYFEKLTKELGVKALLFAQNEIRKSETLDALQECNQRIDELEEKGLITAKEKEEIHILFESAKHYIEEKASAGKSWYSSIFSKLKRQ